MEGRAPDHLAARAQCLLLGILAATPEQPGHGLRLLRMRVVAQRLQALEPVHLRMHAPRLLGTSKSMPSDCMHMGMLAET